MISPLIQASALYQLNQLKQVLILDCRFYLNDPFAGYRDYLAAHIPGAHYLDLDKDLSGVKTGKNGRHPLPQKKHLTKKLIELGLQQNQQVVVYDDRESMFAARAWWLLRWLGHANVQVLDGGLRAWIDMGLPLSTEQPTSELGNFKFSSEDGMPTVDVDTLFSQLSQPVKATQTRWQIVDARASDRFHGENETVDSIGGHIPGAVNRYFRDNLTQQGYFKTAEQLREEWLHFIPSQQVAHQCGSGVSACHNLLAMEIAGLPSGALYPGSWSEWCADPSRPIEHR